MKNINISFIIFTIAITQSVFTQARFSAKADFETGTSPYSVAAGDFNGDGMNDMVAVNYGSDSVSVFLNTTTPGAATPIFSAKTDFIAGITPGAVSIGDFNGDGKNDMAVANNGTVSIFLNTTAPGAATPSFSAKTDFITGTSQSSVSIGDFNGDGINDIAMVKNDSASVSVLLNTTAPGATTPAFSAGKDFTTGYTGPISVFIGDFNGDGQNDMAVTNFYIANGYTVSVFLNSIVFPTPTSVELNSFTEQVPETFSLAQNYPNPFNPSTTFHFALPMAGNVKLAVLNILGQEVSEVVNKHLPAGTYNFSWNAKNLSSGVYFLKLRANQFSSVRKMLLLK